MPTSSRKIYDEELLQLDTMLARMGHSAGGAIESALTALKTGDVELARSVIARDSEIDAAEHEVEHRCLTLFLRQQPVASDLRTVSAAMRMISDMERIGDQASDIAEIARDMERSVIIQQVPVGDMARTAIGMVTDSVDAFVRSDLKLAHAVIARDDELDGLFLDVRQKLTDLIAQGKDGGMCLDLLMVAKYFERIGDHACNIAQWVEYAITGEYEED